MTFTYPGAEAPALSDVSFRVPGGKTVALVGPSGGGKTTAASLIPRFWDAQEEVLVGRRRCAADHTEELMDKVAFVFQDTHLFKTSILENIRAARPDATREEALRAARAAQADDILEKMPQGIDTVIGTKGYTFPAASSSGLRSPVRS